MQADHRIFQSLSPRQKSTRERSKTVTLAVAVAIATVCLAVPNATAKGAKTMPVASLPPPKFDVPFRGKLTIYRTESEAHTAAMLGKKDAAGSFPGGTPKQNWTGVAMSRRGTTSRGEIHCEIFLVKDEVIKALGYSLAFLLRHELGHCNGWVGHSGGKKVPMNFQTKMPELPSDTRWLPASEFCRSYSNVCGK